MTAALEEDVRARQASADGSVMLQDELDQTDLTPTSAPAVTRVPLHGPVDSQDVMCAKVIFALCGSVFPHPLLLAQQILGIEDQDFPEFQLNVAEAGNNCIDILAAYLTNLRVMQMEDEPNPAVSLAMIQPRHTATVASVAAKARDLLCELASARATVKPRKAPKNKAIESAARAAAAAATTSSATSSGPQSATSTATTSASAATCSSDATGGSTIVSGTGAAIDADGEHHGSQGGCAALFCEDAAGSESNDEADSVGGHQDTSRSEGDVPPTAREEEERLLVALQGPAAAEETLKMARARPAGCKSGSTSGAEQRPGETCANGASSGSNGSSALHSGPGGNGGGSLAGSPRAPPPAPPPARTTSAMAQYAAAGGVGGGPASSRHSQDLPGGRAQRTSNGMTGGAAAAAAVSASNLQTALSCPVTGLPEMLGGGASGNGNTPPGSSIGHPAGGHHQPGQHGPRRGGPGAQQQQHPGAGQGGVHFGGQGQGPPGQGQGMHGGHGGRRGGGGMGGNGSARGSPTPPAGHGTASVQQQLQQQQLAVAQLLGLRNAAAYGSAANNSAATYNNLMALQGAYGAVGGLGAYGPAAAAAAAAGRLDLNSMAATTAALELAAAQQAAVLNNAVNAAGMHQFGGYGGAGGFGGQPGGLQNHLGSLAGQLGGAGGMGGMGNPGSLMHHQAQLQQQHSQQHQQQQQQQAAAAAAALLQQSGGMMLADSMKGAGGASDWSNILLQAQLAAGSLA